MPPDTFIPAKRRVHRGRKAVASSPTPPPVTGPVLVAAAFDAGQMFVTLTFDRDVDGYNVTPEAITVFDGSAVTEYRSTTDVNQPAQTTVEILMLEAGEFTGAGQRMSAAATNGI